MLNLPGPAARAWSGLRALLLAYPGTLALGLLGLAVVGAPVAVGLAGPLRSALAGAEHPAGLLVALLVVLAPAALALTGAALLVVLAVSLRRALGHLARVMSGQDFGLCTGMRDPGSAEPPALTEWLYLVLQQISGKPADAPLTFGDLRRLEFPETPGKDGVVLRVMTTCLTAGRPYTLPMEERLYFDPEDLARYFPSEVVTWMRTHPRSGEGYEDSDTDALAREHRVAGHPRPLLALPAPDDFPVIVAVRMSLSFPILLSAIPLHRLTVRKEGTAWARGFERLVFTDGGVCSNLPIHLFDSPLPAWPTFALNLRDDLPEKSSPGDRVVPPRRGRSYQGDRYDLSTSPGLGATVGFLTAIVNTMQNWRDTLQRAAPGARERVFTVRHTSSEGGLNLDMDPGAIGRMADSGALAARAMVESFQRPPGTEPQADDWEHHRWVRLRLLLPVLREFLDELRAGAGPGTATPTVEQLLKDAPMERSYELNARSREAGWTLLEELSRVAADVAVPGVDFQRTGPRPEGDLRVTPRF
jgi:hypothetical protein